jgi:hypothetical protein
MSFVVGNSELMLRLLHLLGRVGSYVQSDVLAAIADNCIEFLALAWRRSDIKDRDKLCSAALNALGRLPVLNALRERELVDEMLTVCEGTTVCHL